ncbi:F1F0 ATP synthase subunit 4 NDAI_0E02770 [Naumovozyma dairenensis CBS 421]|uniref:ATP synthase subunit 4 n=1 Tax=Naumovozyma dairenensis (strain ATCC 10597 / BCRC 20456 / CBS 421 / NBRC 0211 / NRRL Y-12639) TaxID=1071378 RepID=G0WBH4_NAUDC|nr:hypothetical protein NDAI_0E02770 [Naumovozyma dairenensis CBS 421]CCD25094.1 hypothetical protein NDAI_0E02770 [Naumovozyma dairenensis CBS 421]
MNCSSLALKASARPLFTHGIRRLPIYSSIRYNSSSSTPTPQKDPKTQAQSLINALPGSNVLSKTGILATSVAATVYAISNELYVINDESILLATFLTFTALSAKFLAPMYNEFAEARLKKVSDILNASRGRHVDAIKERINMVSELQNVTETTKVLFDVSKETIELEAKNFELKQKVDLANQAKSVLDSWVRHETALRQLQQKQLTSSLLSKVESQLNDPKFQDKVLQQSISDVERLFTNLK